MTCNGRPTNSLILLSCRLLDRPFNQGVDGSIPSGLTNRLSLGKPGLKSGSPELRSLWIGVEIGALCRTCAASLRSTQQSEPSEGPYLLTCSAGSSSGQGGRYGERRQVRRPVQFRLPMPSGIAEQHQSVASGRHMLGDLVDMALHGPGVGIGYLPWSAPR